MKAKTVSEALGNILKPKSRQDIVSDFRKMYRLKDLQLSFNSLPTLEEYLENFVFQIEKWDTNKVYWESMKMVDVTEEAKEIIRKLTNDLKGKLRVLQTSGGSKKGLVDFMYKMNNFYKFKMSPNRVIFPYYLKTPEYGFVGDKSGFGAWFIPENFLKNYFKT